MSKIKPSDVLLIGIIINILNTLFKDTESKHKLSTIPLQYWTAILLIILLISSLTLLWNAESNFQNNVLSYAIMLSFIGSILNILDVSLNIIAYKIVLTFISILTFVSLLKVQGNFSRIYLGLFLLVFLDVQTILYDSLKFYKEIKVLFEILFVFGIGYYVYKANFNSKQQILLLASGVLGIPLGNIILNRDLLFLIFSTVINQLMGTYDFAIDLFGVGITLDMIFILHITEFIILAIALLLKRPSLLLLSIILTGFDMTYAPVAGFRAAAIMYQLNRNDTRVNQFDLLNRSKNLQE